MRPSSIFPNGRRSKKEWNESNDGVVNHDKKISESKRDGVEFNFLQNQEEKKQILIIYHLSTSARTAKQN